MTDLEKVKNGLDSELEEGGSCAACPYKGQAGLERCYIKLLIDARKVIEKQPEIVRCKDCKYWWYGNYCDKHGKEQENADWFCADGERK